MESARKFAAVILGVAVVIPISGLLCAMYGVIKCRNEMWESSLKRPP